MFDDETSKNLSVTATDINFRPLLSVVVPTCHRNDALKQCLERLRPKFQMLDVGQYEVIVTDDGSKSTAQNLIESEYSWARWIAGPRRGPAANRNHGANCARGSWLIFTDDDCVPDAQWLQTYAQNIEAECAIYEGKTICREGFRMPLEGAPTNLNGGCLWSCNLMIKREVFQQLKGFDECFPNAADEDTDFRERVQKTNLVMRFVPDAIVNHPPSRRIWGVKTAKLWESKVRLWYKHRMGAPPQLGPFLLQVLGVRLRQIYRSPFSPDWFLALAGGIVELWWIGTHLRQWREKHRGCALFVAYSDETQEKV